MPIPTPAPATPTTLIDEYSVVPLIICPLASQTQISTATCFLWQDGQQAYMFTNWHVLSGRHPETGRPLNAQGATPDQVGVVLNDAATLGAWRPTQHPLYDAANNALWRMHPRG